MTRGAILWLLSGLYGASGVLLGAFGAHGLRGRLGPLEDGPLRLGWWETAAHYHLIHALALAAAATLFDKTGSPVARIAGWCFAVGVLLFSGSLYAMTLTGNRSLGAVTPLGGLAMVAGWGLIAWTAVRA